MSARETISAVASAMSDELWCLFATYIPSINMVKGPRTLLSAAALAPRASGLHPVPGPDSASAVFDAFLSYSLEFAFFPDFAGGHQITRIDMNSTHQPARKQVLP